jgi:hypothetical protein
VIYRHVPSCLTKIKMFKETLYHYHKWKTRITCHK